MPSRRKRNSKSDRSQSPVSKEPGRGEAAALPVQQSFILSPKLVFPAVLFFLGFVVYLFCYFIAWAPRSEYLKLLFVMVFDFGGVTELWFGNDWSQVAFLDRWPMVLGATAILALAFMAGGLLIDILGAGRGLTRLERFVFSEGVGLNLLSLLTLAIGLIGGLQNRWLFYLPLGAVVVAYGVFWYWNRARRGEVLNSLPWPSSESQPHSVSKRLVLIGSWLLALFMVVFFLGAMVPSAQFDVREYHLQVPKEWYQSGSVSFLPHNIYGNMPMGAEMHAVLGMVLSFGERDWWWGAMIGKTVVAAYGPLAALGLLAAGRRFFSPLAGAAAALIYISTPWIARVSMMGLIDGALAFYLLMAVYAMMLWRASNAFDKRAGENEKPEQSSSQPMAGLPWGRLALAGFFAGAAAACKYPGVPFVVVPVAAWALFAGWRVNFRAAAIFGLAAALSCGLWYGKNFVMTGNPTYPLLSSVFDGKLLTPEKVVQLKKAHAVPTDFKGRRYSLGLLRDAAYLLFLRSDWLNLLAAPFTIVAVMAFWRRRELRVFAGLILYVFVCWWLFTHRIDRFWLPAMPLIAMLAGVGFAWRSDVCWRWASLAVLSMGLFWNFFLTLTPAMGDVRFFVSMEDLYRGEPIGPREELARVHLVHRYLNREAANVKSVLLVGDSQPFDLEMPVFYHTCFDECIFQRWMEGRSRKERLEKLRENNISHVFVYWREIDRFRSPGNYGFTDYVARPLVRRELVQEQGVLKRVDLPLHPDAGELFEVVYDDAKDE